MRALILPALIALAGCGEPRLRVLTPPAELAHCAEEPVSPSLAAIDWTSVATAQPIQRARDAAMLAYVLALRTAGGDCRSRVEGLADWIDVAGKSAR